MTINVRKPVEAKAEAFIANASHSRPAEEASGAADGAPEARPVLQAGGVLTPGRTTVEEL